jgi:mannose-6-phosphate isomerase-like protein (cupin superfamily)
VEAPIGPKTLAGPLHTYRHEDGCWYVVEREFAAQAGDEEVHDGPGALIFAPRGIPHTYWNYGSSPATKISGAGLSISWLAVRLIGRPSGN